MLEYKNDIGFSSLDTVVSNSCTICFVFSLLMCFLCLLSAVFMDLFLRILTYVKDLRTEVKRVKRVKRISQRRWDNHQRY